ncbi:MAG: hypothetical protein ABGY95_01400 [Rubritalea sp.]|uniref:hypothetical protein n=1 Tax=Rubritalea sp. TaxID=2109375 RepID=UPI003241E1C9
MGSTRWKIQFSNSSEEVRERAFLDLTSAIDDSAKCSGHAVLIAPAVNNKNTIYQEAWERSI